jgi:poly(A) polymerase
LFEFFRSRFRRDPKNDGPTIVPRDRHGISRRNVSEPALKVLYRLNKAGYEAYMVGGGVRDLLLGREPKDFDIATDARPEEVKRLFGNCRLIGRRFRLAHVRFGNDVVEVATFRALAGQEPDEPDEEDDDGRRPDRDIDDTGRILRDNVWGSLEEDAFRRDFTVNALYYNIADFSVVDYVGGVKDLEDGKIRLIGEPEDRYREDPVRMLRAVRFAVKLGFRIERSSEKPLRKLAPLLADIPAARLYEEVNKLFLAGFGVQTFEMLRATGLFGQLFPQTEAALAKEEQGFPMMFVIRALENTDERVAADKSVTPAFLYAALLWEPVRLRAKALEQRGMSDYEALRAAGDDVTDAQVQRVALPRRFSVPMREIWELQTRFAITQGKRAQRFIQHPRFRAAYDFFVLRAEAGEVDKKLAAFWTEAQELQGPDQDAFFAGKLSGRGAPRGGQPQRQPQQPRQPQPQYADDDASEALDDAPLAAHDGPALGPDGAPRKRRRRRGGRGRRRGPKPDSAPPSA